jgi:hypothetical protein
VLEAFDEVMASAYSVSLIGDFASPVIRELWQKTRVEWVGEGDDPRPAATSCRASTSSTGGTRSTRSGPCGRSAIGPRKHPTEVMALLADIEAALAPYEPPPRHAASVPRVGVAAPSDGKRRLEKGI